MTSSGTANLTIDPPVSRFGDLLRHWRQLRKLSQLELALQSKVSQRHISFLELDRARPSRDMVIQLSESLDIPLRDRNQMLIAGGFAPLYRQRDLSGEDMAAVRRALEITLKHHQPYPALVMDKDWNVVMLNDSVTPVFGALADLESLWQKTCGDGPRNMLRLTFHPDGIAPLISNWAEVAPIMLIRMLREAQTAGTESLSTLIEEIMQWPGIPSECPDTAWDNPPPPILPLEFEVQGHKLAIFSMISTFGTPQDITTDELRIETFFPADDLTDQIIRSLQNA